jgi:hypothetical protein
MTTVSKAISYFSGDIEIWLKKVHILSQGANLSESAIIAPIIIKLTGIAQSCLISLTNGNISNTTLESLLLSLQKRFRNQPRPDEILERFLLTKTSKTYEEYTKLLEEVSILL